MLHLFNAVKTCCFASLRYLIGLIRSQTAPTEAIEGKAGLSGGENKEEEESRLEK